MVSMNVYDESKRGRQENTGRFMGRTWPSYFAILVAGLPLIPGVASASYSSSGFLHSNSSSVTGSTNGGTGGGSVVGGQPTITPCSGGAHVYFTAGLTATAGSGNGVSNYFQEGNCTASPTYTVLTTGSYTLTLDYTPILHAADFSGTANCTGGGSANATSDLIIQAEVVDTTSNSIPFSLQRTSLWPASVSPYTTSCSGTGINTIQSPMLSSSGTITMYPVSLTSGDVVQVNVVSLAVGSAYTSGSAKAAADIDFPPSDNIAITGVTLA
jgi:hypothetical protein